jgi:hypothetical protein
LEKLMVKREILKVKIQIINQDASAFRPGCMNQINIKSVFLLLSKKNAICPELRFRV